MKNKNYFKKAVLLILVCSTQFIMAQVPSYVPTSGLVGYWPFNGNANDVSGNANNGTNNGATLTTDRNGNANSAYSFNGTSNFIEVPDNNLLDVSNKFTISLWMKISDYSVALASDPQSTVLSKPRQPGMATGYCISAYYNLNLNKFSFNYNIGASGGGQTSNAATPLNTWINIIYTYDGSTSKLYKNGVLDSSSIISYVLPNFPTSLFFGKEFDNTSTSKRYFKGLIDDVGIWNRALSQQEINDMYNQVAIYSDNCNAVSGSLTQGLVAYYPFCGNANDDSGHGNNGTVNGATLTTDRFGNANSAYNFNGTSNYILIPNSSNLSNFTDVTISGWVNISQFPSSSVSNGLAGLVTKWYGSGSCGGVTDNYACYLRSNSQLLGGTNQYRVYPNMLQSPTNLTNSNWYHFVMVHNSLTGGSFYINGILVSTYATLGSICSSTNPLYIGCDNGLGTLNRFLNGKLDDIGIWNRALSASEVTQLYNQNQCFTNTTVTDTLVINVGQMSYSAPVTYANNITIAPNPASTQININFNNITDLTGGTINITNSLGQQVATTLITATGTNTTMQLTTWGGSGLYFVQIINPQGQIVDIKKILLQ